MEPVKGVGGWIWHSSEFVDNVTAIWNLNLDYVLIKVVDGVSYYNDGTELRTICSKLKERNIRPFGWGYVRPNEATVHAEMAAIRCKALGLEYYSVDFEMEFEQVASSEANSAASTFLSVFKKNAPGVGLLGSSFYLPQLHSGVPYHTMISGCDYWQPQAYWENHAATTTVQRAVTSGKVLGKPMVISLPSYDMRSEGGRMPTTDEIVNASNTAFNSGASAVDFFSLDEGLRIPQIHDGIVQVVKKHGFKK